MSVRPPPPPGRSRRRHVRYELYAQVELRHGDDVHLLPVVNISAGGVLLQLADSEELTIQPGDHAVVFLDMDVGGEPLAIELEAEVVRVDRSVPGAPGVGLMWTSDDPQVAGQLMRLLSHLRAST